MTATVNLVDLGVLCGWLCSSYNAFNTHSKCIEWLLFYEMQKSCVPKNFFLCVTRKPASPNFHRQEEEQFAFRISAKGERWQRTCRQMLRLVDHAVQHLFGFLRFAEYHLFADRRWTHCVALLFPISNDVSIYLVQQKKFGKSVIYLLDTSIAQDSFGPTTTYPAGYW